ncbi:MAG: hypothetical protein NVS3B25_00250 [Hymenobacter sp.]
MHIPMDSSRKTLLAVAAFAAFAATSCSEKKAERAATTTEITTDKTGDDLENALDSAKADIAREPGDTAVVQDKPSKKVIEKVPAKHK